MILSVKILQAHTKQQAALAAPKAKQHITKLSAQTDKTTRRYISPK
jgi:hypothetical protein